MMVFHLFEAFFHMWFKSVSRKVSDELRGVGVVITVITDFTASSNIEQGRLTG